MTYAFVGLGNMAGANLRGMLASGRFLPGQLRGHDLDQAKADALQAELHIAAFGTAAEALQGADAAILAVKPQHMEALLRENSAALQQVPLIISIAAGLPISFYESILGPRPLLRVMPSILCRVAAAASAVCGSAEAKEADYALAEGVFGAVGSLLRVPEALFPAFTAVAASAPAFVFQFIEALCSAGVKAGLSRELALQAATQTVLGSALLLKQSGEHPMQLADQVTSPGGTTIEGLHRLEALGFQHAVHEAVAAVIETDRRLSRQEG